MNPGFTPARVQAPCAVILYDATRYTFHRVSDPAERTLTTFKVAGRRA